MRAINVSDTINSGQIFLWRRIGDSWFGIDGGDVLRVDAVNTSEHGKFFRLDDDYDAILSDISRDALVRQCVARYDGLRLLRQDPFQCCISFIVSSNSGIPSIKTRLERLCRTFGDDVDAGGERFHLFPSPRKLAAASQAELLGCGLGYRAKFVKSAACTIHEKIVDLEALKKTDYQNAKEQLTGIAGVGDKVADCIMLFSLEKLDAFPLDTWTTRILDGSYADRFSVSEKSLTGKRYDTLHHEIREYFGEYCGYSQQFLFKWMRDRDGGRWLE